MVRRPRSRLAAAPPFALATALLCATVHAEEGGRMGGSIGGTIAPDEEARRPAEPAEAPRSGAGRALFSFPVNTDPDGWAALKAAPDPRAPRLAKVYDGTLFTVVGRSGRWLRVRLASGETGWIIDRLVGCCR